MLRQLRALVPRGIQAMSPEAASIYDHLLLRAFATAPSDQMASIKELRERSGAPVSEVKSALQAAEWDMDKAVQELRKKGMAAATKKSTRRAAEGLVGIAKGDNGAAIVEINSETDFVARNDQFTQLVTTTAQAALQASPSAYAPDNNNNYELDISVLSSTKLQDGSTVGDAVTAVAGAVRENIKLRRAFAILHSNGGYENAVIGSYLHAGVGSGVGRIAALLALKPADNGVKLQGSALTTAQELAQKLAMHVVGALPKYLDTSTVPQSALDAERAVLTEQASRTGKPTNIIEKMVEGRLNKYYEEVCLLEQPFIMDDKHKVKEVVGAAGKAAGTKLEVAGFVRVQVGEGLEEESKDFASEVADTLKEASK